MSFFALIDKYEPEKLYITEKYTKNTSDSAKKIQNFKVEKNDVTEKKWKFSQIWAILAILRVGAIQFSKTIPFFSTLKWSRLSGNVHF